MKYSLPTVVTHTKLCAVRMLISLAVLHVATDPVRAQTADDLAVSRIFSATYAAKGFGPARWLDGGVASTTVEPASTGEGSDIVRYETASGVRTVLISAQQLTPQGATAPLPIDDYQWSNDGAQLLLFTNSVRVWRQNTRGDYWVLNRNAGTLTRLGGDGTTSTMMFAKFSPNGQQVAYVRDNDLWMQQVSSLAITRLTSNGSRTSINGTSDWVYEEELGIRDGFSWSPDGKRLAFYHFDATPVRDFLLINTTDSLYPFVTPIPYPKAGTPNSRVTVGVMAATGGAVQWMDVIGDTNDSYIARMEWIDTNTVLLQHLNRAQNANSYWIGNATTGHGTSVFTDRDLAWVDVNDITWLDNNRSLVFSSEAEGWRHIYRMRRDGTGRVKLTPGAYDVANVAGVDEANGGLYIVASPDNATQRYLYRVPLATGGAAQRITPAGTPGVHAYNVSPNGQWAFHTYSKHDTPPVIELVSLPSHKVSRTFQDNAALRTLVAALPGPPTELFRVTLPSGVTLDGWMIRPADFDSTKKYPVLMHVYGEPASQNVMDRWGGNNALFHRSIANDGYIVLSVDNRGTPSLKGRAWRKVVYGEVGVLSAQEQAAAIRALSKQRSYLDTTRVGIWGWSGGGSNTLNAMFRFPELFKVGVSVAPVPDQKLYDTIYQERYMGLPQTNVAGYFNGSPINFAERLSGRLLIVHGSGDDNVHMQGTERLVNKLVSLGKRFDVMEYPNRSHCICEGAGTTIHVYSLVKRYIEENLPSGPR